MELYILRHGIAEDAKPGQPDAERALTDEGRQKLRRVLERAHKSGTNPSLILSSPYRRALETAAVAAECLTYVGKVAKSRALEPESSPFDAWDEIRRRAGETAILVSTHEPLSSSLVAFLLDSPSLQVEMKKAALVRVDVDPVRAEPRGVLRWMRTPAVA
jgi:phosphohistidine phosphatase